MCECLDWFILVVPAVWKYIYIACNSTYYQLASFPFLSKKKTRERYEKRTKYSKCLEDGRCHLISFSGKFVAFLHSAYLQQQWTPNITSMDTDPCADGITIMRILWGFAVLSNLRVYSWDIATNVFYTVCKSLFQGLFFRSIN